MVLLLTHNLGSDTQRMIEDGTSKGTRSVWVSRRMLRSGPAAYSCLAALANGRIGCLYERGEKNAYETIRFARLSLGWLTGVADR
jgi:sialidase-1